MPTPYTRQSAFANGDVIDAPLFNAEFDQLATVSLALDTYVVDLADNLVTQEAAANAAQVAAEAAQTGAVAAEATLLAEKLTTVQLIALSNTFAVGSVIDTLGYTSNGDGGGASWKKTATTGTASQSPAQLVDALLNDASGNQWALVEGINSGRALGDLLAQNSNISNDISTQPTYTGSEASVTTAFDGDFSKCSLAIEHRITGADTLTQPAAGYVYYPPAYPNYQYMFNTSGHNESLTGNSGRTAACVHRVKVDHNGQGDAVAFNASVLVRNTKASSTSFLANPAAVLFNGDAFAAADGSYLNVREIGMHDQGFDVAAVGDVIKGDRSNNTGAKDVWWQGYRAQNTGTLPWDVFASAVGEFNYGLDFTYSDFGTDEAAITLKAGQRIYFNATGGDSLSRFPTALPTDYIDYSAGTLKIVVGGSPTLQVSSGQVTSTKPFNTTAHYKNNGTQVVGVQQNAITDSVGGDEQSKINEILTALRNHGLIAT